MAKYAAAEAALAAVDADIQCQGGDGVSTEHGLIPLWGLAGCCASPRSTAK